MVIRVSDIATLTACLFLLFTFSCFSVLDFIDFFVLLVQTHFIWTKYSNIMLNLELLLILYAAT